MPPSQTGGLHVAITIKQAQERGLRVATGSDTHTSNEETAIGYRPRRNATNTVLAFESGSWVAL